ncbi:hypothetical protein KCP78_18645 [Salmonella enterica subsp. enterica]|nr:hypothetical protein KCP78_18645 [Salmonella enterica subsp. enterica]
MKLASLSDYAPAPYRLVRAKSRRWQSSVALGAKNNQVTVTGGLAIWKYFSYALRLAKPLRYAASGRRTVGLDATSTHDGGIVIAAHERYYINLGITDSGAPPSERSRILYQS